MEEFRIILLFLTIVLEMEMSVKSRNEKYLTILCMKNNQTDFFENNWQKHDSLQSSLDAQFTAPGS